MHFSSEQFHSVSREVKSTNSCPSKHLKRIVMPDVNSNSSLVSDEAKHNFHLFGYKMPFWKRPKVGASPQNKFNLASSHR